LARYQIAERELRQRLAIEMGYINGAPEYAVIWSNVIDYTRSFCGKLLSTGITAT